VCVGIYAWQQFCVMKSPRNLPVLNHIRVITQAVFCVMLKLLFTIFFTYTVFLYYTVSVCKFFFSLTAVVLCSLGFSHYFFYFLFLSFLCMIMSVLVQFMVCVFLLHFYSLKLHSYRYYFGLVYEVMLVEFLLIDLVVSEISLHSCSFSAILVQFWLCSCS
jgi:hypothetical protein